MKRLSTLGLMLFLLLPQVALASSATGAEEAKFNPEEDFDPGEWIPIHLGPLDLSINKTVAYLILGTIVTESVEVAANTASVGNSTPKSVNFSSESGSGMKPIMLIVQMKRKSDAT